MQNPMKIQLYAYVPNEGKKKKKKICICCSMVNMFIATSDLPLSKVSAAMQQTEGIFRGNLK